MIRRIMKWNRTWVVLVAVGLGALNWIVDCILHVQIYHEGTLTQQLFTQEPVEILLRSSGIALLLGFGIALQLAISKRKRLEDDLLRTDDVLRAKEEEFRVIFDNAADGILLAEMESKKFHLGNNAMCRMLGYSLEEIKGLGVMDIHPEKDLPYVVDQFERQVRGEFTLSRDLPVKRKDGSVFHADVNATTMKLAEKTYLVGFFHDTTERTEVEQALSRSNAELESANQELMKLDWMKSDFVSNVSHELRTPLTAVKAYAETLLEYDSLSEEQRESFLKIILEQSDRLATLVDDLLDLSKIEAGKLEMKLTPVNVNRAIATAMQSVAPGAQKKGIEISVRQSQEDGYVLADENRLVQVLVNLINNSVKFTEQGGRIDVISVPVADSARGSVQSEVEPTYQRITIADNGIGIATEELDRVFDKFKQVTEKTAGKPTGTGLGLTICRSLVEAMGGRIWAENSGGKGSRLHFTLPLADGPEMECDEPKTHNGQAVDELSVASHT